MEKPSYYAILTAEVRYATNLSFFQKILYAEVTALAQKNGYCFASNKHFAKLYDGHPTRIGAVIQDMASKGYLDIEIEKNAKGTVRKIYI